MNSPKFILLTLLTILALRVALAAHIDLVADEAYYAAWATAPQWSYLDHPPLIAWTLWALQPLQPLLNTELHTRLTPLLCSLSTLVACAAIARRHLSLSWHTTLSTLLILSLTPALHALSILHTPDPPLTTCWAWATFWTLELTHHKHTPTHAAWMLSITSLLALHAKLTGLLIPICALLSIWMVNDPKKRSICLQKVLISALFTAPLALPFLLHSLDHQHTFAFQALRHQSRILPNPLRPLELASASLALLGPILGLFALRSIQHIPNHTPTRTLWTFSTPLLILTLLLALLIPVEANWPAPAAPIFALALAHTLQSTPKPRIHTAWITSNTLLTLPFVALLILPPNLLPHTLQRHIHTPRLWASCATQTARSILPPHTPLSSPNVLALLPTYQDTALLNTYSPLHATTFRAVSAHPNLAHLSFLDPGRRPSAFESLPHTAQPHFTLSFHNRQNAPKHATPLLCKHNPHAHTDLWYIALRRHEPTPTRPPHTPPRNPSTAP